MHKFIDYSWWKDVTIATTGTIIGIVVTFGTTAWLEDKTRKEMADKTVIMTLHNLDSSMDNLSNLLGEMQSNDTLFHRVLSLMPDSLGVMGNDSLEMVVSRFASMRTYTTDKSTRRIFSSSFEVWQNIDDAKVISRIGNCYSMLDLCYKEYDKIEQLRAEAFKAYWNECPPQDYADAEEAVRVFLKRNDVRYAIDMQANITPILVSVNDIARQLNERNKEVLGITQDELDEVGNLLDKNEYFTDEDYRNQKKQN
ncbi:hypothetical protein E5358_00605 [Palleniella muris]|uniref:Uncharacterized protein n=1 Tax=Palleniella muris TaxID=3038145 RepID=A0AC61QUE9_9BACT|nr:hypothetical protein [Palleniella muris]TGX84170.1 hypothetical protein E5358_00605 [Palleniella muris]